MSDTRVKTQFGWKDALGTQEGKTRVAGDIKWYRDSKKLAAAGNYDAEDVLSESTAVASPWHYVIPSKGVIWFAHAVCTTTALAWILTHFLFKERPTSTLLDAAANTAPAAADRNFYVAPITFGGMTDLGGMSEIMASPSTYGGLPIYYDLNGQHDLYGILVTNIAETSEAAGMTMEVRLAIEGWE